MLAFALILLFIAMGLGLYVLTYVLKDKRTPKPVVVLHGVFAGFGLLIVLTYLAIGHATTLSIVGATLLGIAAVGGFIMFGIDVSKKPIPKVLALVHPLLAATGVFVLVYFAITTLT